MQPGPPILVKCFESDSDFLNRVMKNIKDKALAKDDKVFELK